MGSQGEVLNQYPGSPSDSVLSPGSGKRIGAGAQTGSGDEVRIKAGDEDWIGAGDGNRIGAEGADWIGAGPYR